MKKSVSTRNQDSFRGLSIQQRLPLLICILLLGVMIAFGWATYIGVNRAAVDMGKERLHTLADQLTSMLGQQSQLVRMQTQAAASNPAIIQLTKGKGTDTAAKIVLERLAYDSLWVKTMVLDKNKNPLVTVNYKNVNIDISSDSVINKLATGPEPFVVGGFYQSHDSVYYPIAAPIIDSQQIIGYVLRWRLNKASPQAIAQFSQLLGDNTTLFVGNRDGSLWTDLNKPIKQPDFNLSDTSHFFEYSKSASGKSKDLIALSRHVPGTNWSVLIELSHERTLNSAMRFFYWIVVIGSLLLLIGIFAGWIMSRRITGPLNQLTDAATKMARGNLAVQVESRRKDELGKLARSFNLMTQKIRDQQQTLEKKVQERTALFEDANKELESFSYSVSHDLRAPLRIINSYTEIVTADYKDKLDEEGVRMLGIIAASAKKMGHLIDDLLNLSRTSRKELIVHEVDMKQLVESLLKEQEFLNSKATINIGNLLPADCDSGLIRQVWINLLSNAIKYSSTKERPVIDIDSTEGLDEVVYSVRDNGVGFDMKYSDKLFGVFQRLHKASDFEGTGVGLALVQRIVTRHGGKVWFEAMPGEGATFYFSIPIAEKMNLSTAGSFHYEN